MVEESGQQKTPGFPGVGVAMRRLYGGCGLGGDCGVAELHVRNLVGCQPCAFVGGVFVLANKNEKVVGKALAILMYVFTIKTEKRKLFAYIRSLLPPF